MNQPLVPRSLGRLLNHDERSRAYPALMASSVKTKMWRTGGKRLDQGDVGSCTGNAMAAWLNSRPAHKAFTGYDDQDDALDYYRIATTFDPFPGTYPPDDTGSSGLAVCKAAQTVGRISAYSHAFGFDQMLAALMLAPVLVGTNWYASMYQPSAAGYVDIAGTQPLGGHEYLVQGVNVRDRYLWCVNSWGTGWGLQGRFKVPFTVMQRLLAEDGDATVPVVL